MQVLETIQEMQERVAELRAAGGKTGLVPTMGCLHDGHLSLIDIARERSDSVAVSIFVNPAQFGPNEDYERYPRDRDRDLKLCRNRGADIVFYPREEEFYPADYSTYVEEEKLSAGMCGVSRPAHFRGVCTVVAKLFNIVQPALAVFGQKDAQQAAVIKKMVRDLHFPVEIIVGPTVREPDGLAMSSRNNYLDGHQRRDACMLYQALLKGKELADHGIRNADRILAEITHAITEKRRLRVIYAAAVDRETLEPLRHIIPGQTLLAAAVWCDEVRLIDNLVV